MQKTFLLIPLLIFCLDAFGQEFGRSRAFGFEDHTRFYDGYPRYGLVVRDSTGTVIRETEPVFERIWWRKDEDVAVVHFRLNRVGDDLGIPGVSFILCLDLHFHLVFQFPYGTTDIRFLKNKDNLFFVYTNYPHPNNLPLVNNGIITRDGKVIFEPIYDGVGCWGDKELYARTEGNDRLYYIIYNIESGKRKRLSLALPKGLERREDYSYSCVPVRLEYCRYYFSYGIQYFENKDLKKAEEYFLMSEKSGEPFSKEVAKNIRVIRKIQNRAVN